MESVEIIILQPNQWGRYKNIRLKALQEEPQAFASSYDANVKELDEMWMKRLEDALKGENQWLSFAKQGSSLVGMVGAFREQNSDTVHIISTYVVKEARGQGISRKLMDHLIGNIVKNREIKKLQLGVTSTQIPALNLYKSFGFSIFEKEMQKLGDGKEHEVYKMEKLINENN